MNETSTTASVISHLRHWLARTRPDATPDADLLHRYVRAGEDTAFALLVDRHGPMVLGAARRIVGDYHLAEDVFQAAFLTLARRAASLRRPAALPAWLHQTTCHLALSALRARKRRQRAEAEAIDCKRESLHDDPGSRERLALLDEELRRLPERYRLPVVLCCLEGRTQDEAAALLGWTPGSVKGRLERGRRRLKERLLRRGLTFAAAAGVSLMLERPLLAESLRAAALRCASRLPEGASPLVLALADGTSQPFRAAGWKAILVVAAVGLAGAGIGLASLSRGPEQAAPAAVAAGEKPPVPKAEPDVDPLPRGAIARLGWSHLRIGNGAFALAPDGRTIVTVTPQGVVRRFDAKTGRLLERREITDRGDADPMGQSYAQLSNDGKVVAIAERQGGGRVTVWDVVSGKMLFRRESTAKRRTAFGALSPDGRLLALIEYERYQQALRIADVKTGRMRDIGTVDYNVYGTPFSADGKRIFVSQISAETGGGSSFACFDVPAGKQLWKLPRKGQEFAISPDGKTLLSPTNQGSFQVIELDADSGKYTENIYPYHRVHFNDRFLIAPDNHTVVMNHFGEIALWDLRTRKESRRFTLPKTNGRGYGPEIGALSADSRTAITNLGHLQRWDLTTGKAFFTAPPDESLGGPIERLAFTANGKEVFGSSWYNNSGCWDVATGKQRSLTRFKRIHPLMETSDGLREVIIDSYKTPYEAAIADPIAGKPLHTVRWTDPKEVGINGLRVYTLTADGKTLLTVHGGEMEAAERQSFVTACDVTSGRRLSRFTVLGNAYYPRSPFSPCGRWAVLGGKVYHVGTGTELFAPAGEPGERLVPSDREARGPVWFSADGRLLAGFLLEESVAADTLAVWELASGRVLARFPKARFVAQVAFAPDGRTFARLDGRGVRLDDLLTGARLAEFAAPDVTCDLTDRGCATQTLLFAPDGRTLATGHLDGTVLLWKVPQPHEDRRAALTEVEREQLWTDLGSPSPIAARTAIERLIHRPAAAVALLAARFRAPASPADPALAALVKNLDSNVFATREEAARKLRAYGAKAEPVLRRELAGAPSLEMKRRAESVLDALRQPLLRLPLSGENLRGVRAIEVLERVGDAEARKLLQSWTEQTSDVQMAIEARMALDGRARNAKPPAPQR